MSYRCDIDVMATLSFHLDSFTCMVWHIDVCGATQSDVWRDSFVRGPSLVHSCGVMHSYVRCDPFVCGLWICRQADVKTSYLYMYACKCIHYISVSSLFHNCTHGIFVNKCTYEGTYEHIYKHTCVNCRVFVSMWIIIYIYICKYSYSYMYIHTHKYMNI